MNTLKKCAKLKKIQEQSRRRPRTSLTKKNHKNDTAYVDTEIHCMPNKNAKGIWPGGRYVDPRTACPNKNQENSGVKKREGQERALALANKMLSKGLNNRYCGKRQQWTRMQSPVIHTDVLVC